THPVVETWGREWLERGTMSARFRRPVYDGEAVEVVGTVEGGTRAEVETRNPAGEVCALATATLPGTAAPLPSLDDFPTASLPARRHDPSPEALRAIDRLGTVEAGFHAGRVDETLALVGDDLPIYRDLAVAHPTWILFFANAVLAS